MKTLIFGLDLSLNSTGVCVLFVENNETTHVLFYNLVYNDGNNIVTEIPFVNRVSYSIPSHINEKELVLECENEFQNSYNENMIHSNIKAVIASDNISSFIYNLIEKEDPDQVFINMEGYVNPSFMSKRQANTVQDLTIMQGMIRSNIFKMKFVKKKNIKLELTLPNTLKKFFTGDGKADKKKMIDTFMKKWGGRDKIISNQKIDDIIDAFALVSYMMYKCINNNVLF